MEGRLGVDRFSKGEETITYTFHKRKSAGQSFGMIWAPKQSTSGLLARGQLRTRNLEILIIYTVRHDGPGMQTQQNHVPCFEIDLLS